MRNKSSVFINGRFLAQSISGVQRYAREVISALDVLAGEERLTKDFILVAPLGTPALDLEHLKQIYAGKADGHLWEQTSFARTAASGIALSLAGSGPLLLKKQLVVIHDAAIYRHPEHFTRKYVQLHKLIDWALAKRARLGTVSEFSRAELAQVLRCDASSIVVAPNGFEHLRIEPDVSIVSRLGLQDAPFFVTVGNLTKNKNIGTAIQAFSKLQRGRAKLVAVGNMTAKVFGAEPLTPSPDVMFPGRLSDAEVAGLLRHATALVFPSIYEGFGIPPLEAMVNECPVIASSIPAVREVCGPAALYFNPKDADALAAMMAQALSGRQPWREARVREGLARVERFSWKRSAEIIAAACQGLS